MPHLEAALALAKGREAIGIYQQLSSPHVAMLTEHLQKFAVGGESVLPQVAGPGIVVGGWGSASAAAGPGLLRMAFSAVKSLTKFVGSGMKTVAPSVREDRLHTCAACDHHTGIRCRLCGCFTAVKSRLPHEHCPLEKWPN